MRALIFSNYASGETTVATIRAACRRAGIEHVQVVGLGSGRVEASPEVLLPEFDLVFAKARCAR